MKKNTNYFFRSFEAELIKIKNTLGLWSILILPSFVTFMNFMIYYNHPEIITSDKFNPWVLFTTNTIIIWSLLFLPLFIAIITFYINYSEHKSNGWKHLYALPIPKWSVFVGKFILSILLVVFTMLFLFILNYVAMIILGSENPKIPFNKFPFDSIITITFLKITLASLGIIAIQFVISILFQNFIYPLGLGVLATLSTAFLLSWKNIVYFPYSYTAFAAQDIRTGNSIFFTNQVVLGLIVGFVAGMIGYLIHSRKRIV